MTNKLPKTLIDNFSRYISSKNLNILLPIVFMAFTIFILEIIIHYFFDTSTQSLVQPVILIPYIVYVFYRYFFPLPIEIKPKLTKWIFYTFFSCAAVIVSSIQGTLFINPVLGLFPIIYWGVILISKVIHYGFGKFKSGKHGNNSKINLALKVLLWISGIAAFLGAIPILTVIIVFGGMVIDKKTIISETISPDENHMVRIVEEYVDAGATTTPDISYDVILRRKVFGLYCLKSNIHSVPSDGYRTEAVFVKWVSDGQLILTGGGIKNPRTERSLGAKIEYRTE